ncbi:MAG: hypothetical protein NVSMB19_13650 [Vulcanimicrobiaceae bacterium]
MPAVTILWLSVCAAGAALALRSVAVLKRGSRATALGWALTAAYFAVAASDAARMASAPYHVDYVLLAALAAAFVAAGLRDEPQAEPWWWPSHAGLSGAERRRAQDRLGSATDIPSATSPEGANAVADVEISMRPNGPLLVRGPIVLTDVDGSSIDVAGKAVVALCRCGGSTTKPFCDGTHSKIGFDAATAAVRQSQ